jgi:glyoxylase-like metal-dependent hydrolase (beta-lactamase superfamily II)
MAALKPRRRRSRPTSKALGFDITKVKILLNSHAHFDHAGGLAELKRASGARLLASAADTPVLESGGAGDFIDFGRWAASRPQESTAR